MLILLIAFLLQVNGPKPVIYDNSSIVGMWQYGDSLVSAGYHDRYEFFDNGIFEYHNSEYASDNLLKSVYGTYDLQNDTLMLRIQKINYYTGKLRIGDLFMEDVNPWVYDFDSIQTKNCTEHCLQKALFKINSSDPGNKIRIFSLNGFDFYRINESNY